MPKPIYAHRLDFHDRVEGEILRPMMAWLCEGRALNILDAGCGEGGPTLMLTETGARVWGDEFFILNRDDLHVRYGLGVYVGKNNVSGVRG